MKRRSWTAHRSLKYGCRCTFRAPLALVGDAEQHFQAGLERSSERGVVGLAQNREGLAEVAERRGDHALAMQHLDTAGELFSRHGAKLYLDEVLAKKEFLRA